ncbi:MAG: hypothetical protein HY902_15800 [Deltaproteobacteria bacterium]|nr:hypothetical protein [Deltaproteobacteria bacterium]
MRTWLIGLALLAALATPAVAAPATAEPGAELRLEHSCDLTASLFWLLSALTGDPFIEGKAWLAWWQGEGMEQPGDAALLAEFGRLKATYRGRLIDAKARENRWVPVPPPPGSRLDVRFAALFLGARDLADLDRRAEVLLTEADQAALHAVTAAYAPRLQMLLDKNSWLAKFNSDFAEFSRNSQMNPFLQRVGRWLGAAPGGRMRLHFVPAPPSAVSHGRRLGQDLVVEVRQGDTPARRSDVVVHEAVHWLQERAGLDDDPALIGALFSQPGDTAARAWELLGEGTATAIGQGVWQAKAAPKEFADSRARSGGWYVDANIDPFAKALYPSLAAALEGDGSLRDLAAELNRAAAATPAPQKLADILHRYVLISDHRDAPWLQAAWWQQVPPRSVWRADLAEAASWADRCQGTTVVALATAAEWQALGAKDRAKLGGECGKLAGSKRAAVCSAPRAGGARTLVVVAPDTTSLSAALLALTRGPLPAWGWSEPPRAAAAR